EGGFEEEEIDRLTDLGAKIVSLGPRILRTETAGIVASAIVQYEYGDLGVI
ncbi:RsmE family RNA methyltransferase, partial [Gudongella sp.]